jgi:hypothetical protein
MKQGGSMKYLFVALFVIIALPLTTGCAVTNKYGPYYGKVIDAETKEPLEGAAVLIVYKTEQYGLAGAVSHYEDAQEMLTDKNGEFKIPSMRVSTFRILSSWEKYPEVRIFKPGYGCYPMHKDATPDFDYGSLPSEKFVTIELPNVKKEARDERLRNADCHPSPNVRNNKYKKLFHLLQVERAALGLEQEVEPK